MARIELPSLTPLTGKYLKYLLSFIVTLGIGLSPLLLGNKGVPGFRAILALFPADLQDDIAWASLLMSVTAVGVHYFGGETIDPRRLKNAFVATFVFLIVLTFVLYACYKAMVIRIYVPAADAKVAYLVGATMLPKCECAKRNLEIEDCIGKVLTVNPADVAACYPRQEITSRSTLLFVLYMLLMFALGMLIGLVVLKEALPKPAADKPAQ